MPPKKSKAAIKREATVSAERSGDGGSDVEEDPAKAAPPPVRLEYVNPLVLDQGALLADVGGQEGVEAYCHRLVEDLADMVQEMLFASHVDTIAVPWAVQDLITQLYAGMHFSIADRDVVLPRSKGHQPTIGPNGSATAMTVTTPLRDEFDHEDLQVRRVESMNSSHTDSGAATATAAASVTSGIVVPAAVQARSHSVTSSGTAAPAASASPRPHEPHWVIHRDPTTGMLLDYAPTLEEPAPVPADSWSRGVMPSRRRLHLSDSHSAVSYSGHSPTHRAASSMGQRAGPTRSLLSSTDGSRPSRPHSTGAHVQGLGASGHRAGQDGASPEEAGLPMQTSDLPRRRLSVNTAPSAVAGAGPRRHVQVPGTRVGASSSSPATTPLHAGVRRTASTSSGTVPSGGATPLTTNTLQVLQREELTAEDLQIRRDEQTARSRMRTLRALTADIDRQVTALKPATPFTVDARLGVVLKVRTDTANFDPISGSISAAAAAAGNNSRPTSASIMAHSHGADGSTDATAVTDDSPGAIGPTDVTGASSSASPARPASSFGGLHKKPQRARAKKLPASLFFAQDAKLVHPMIASPLQPSGGVSSKDGDVVISKELTLPPTVGGGRPMSRAQFLKVQEGSSGGVLRRASDTGSTGVPSTENTTRGGVRTEVVSVRPQTTPPVLAAASATQGGHTAGSLSQAHASGGGSGQRPSTGMLLRAVKASARPADPSAQGTQAATNAAPRPLSSNDAGNGKPLLQRLRKVRKDVYVPPAHLLSAQDSAPVPPPAAGDTSRSYASLSPHPHSYTATAAGALVAPSQGSASFGGSGSLPRRQATPLFDVRGQLRPMSSLAGASSKAAQYALAQRKANDASLLSAGSPAGYEVVRPHSGGTANSFSRPGTALSLISDGLDL